jgi:ppGpp synthetase/RelA/SpoT-type nucleotidyltranferase
MAATPPLTPALHKQQIEAYVAVRPCYSTYADALKRVFEKACQASFPEASVQTRAKTVSSFAEKVARKWPKYMDAVNDLTDLCGARVIVQTTEQVRAVRGFIEANFEICEREDKTTLLDRNEFGYRDMHYIVRLKPDRANALGITPDELAAIGDKRAELQVRTWLQHAWADTLHDRIYKTSLHHSDDVQRTCALLAALMEEGDRNFTALAEHLDGLIANYTAFATREQVAREIDVQRLILDNEPTPAKKPALALKLARLLIACGEYAKAAAVLEPHSGITGAQRGVFLLELGRAICCLHRGLPESEEYKRGVAHLEEALQLNSQTATAFVPNLRSRASLHARTLAQLGWALGAAKRTVPKAREYIRQAHECEPANPYYLAAMLGREMRAKGVALAPAMASMIRQALRTCLDHATAGTELPYAYFTAGRLSLLLNQGYDALGYYARGIRYCLAKTHCTPPEILAEEESWIRDIHRDDDPPPDCQRVIDLLTLVGQPASDGAQSPEAALILAGGAASLSQELAAKIRPMLQEACAEFRGTIYSGGTNSGVPGCIGDAADALKAEGRKHFRLVGYLPKGVTAHPAYEPKDHGDGFTPDQILYNWSDILDLGVKPKDVLLLGFGGGALSAVEYRVALGLGASVALATGTGGAADALLTDPLWCGVPNLFPLPFDAATIRAFVVPQTGAVPAAALDEMAQAIHAKYVEGNERGLPANMRPWKDLDETFKRANLEQARYSVAILEAAGFEVRPAVGKPVVFDKNDFTDAEVEQMAKLEHGRWNVDRVRDGWRPGKRDNAKKLHDCLVPWEKLPDEIKHYDSDAVRVFPEILAKAGLEVRRQGSGAEGEPDELNR